ncbi:MAG: hypothetical protein D3924_19780, partial [Candidatus Electrothrix sp. AR4]|nr:hypothetical protein [Candidatus Electrothrix sp. AR4]
MTKQFCKLHYITLLSLILAGIFLTTAAYLGWFMIEHLDRDERKKSVELLRTVLQTTQESLHIWLKNHKYSIEEWASSPKLIALVEEQITVPKNRENLISSPILTSLRNFFRDQSHHDLKDFFIISPEHINIASMQDANIGTKNLIAKQRNKHLLDAFQGKTLFIPPVVSDVPLTYLGKLTYHAPTMFVATPIKDKNGQTISVLAGRLSPDGPFSHIAQAGRVGMSGETYFFDKTGRLISNSRFSSSIQQTGL